MTETLSTVVFFIMTAINKIKMYLDLFHHLQNFTIHWLARIYFAQSKRNHYPTGNLIERHNVILEEQHICRVDIKHKFYFLFNCLVNTDLRNLLSVFSRGTRFILVFYT